ncbi:unnamed protein product [Meganyctiphanes norvegica]|uniref:VWFA domain-containing protein n=1 Tax=Meganyctiphanes norvegica TaxID=48144 RepID=A0AAV2Q5N6_MEGNR
MEDTDDYGDLDRNWIPPPAYPGRYISTRNRQKETETQEQWKLPPLVPAEEPEINEAEEDNATNVDDREVLKTDAQLYRIRERNFNGSTKNHSLLKMPSKIPVSMLSENEAMKMAELRKQSTLNIFMGDVSGSMSHYWPKVMDGWNNHVAPQLIGRTMVYTYGTRVNFKRTTTEITQEDFDCDGYDNLTGAFMTILEEIYMCKEKYINVFIVFDGGHNVTNCEPGKVIEKMKAAEGKTVDVYVLGCGGGFPVKYSVGIRSQLHSGSSNLPTLFWAKEDEEDSSVVQQYKDISSYLEGGGSSIQVEVSVSGNILPKIAPQKKFHLGEYIYFDQEPDNLTEVTLKFNKNNQGMIQLTPHDVTVDVLLDKVFRQWNGVLIQLRNRKENIPEDILDFMERLFSSSLYYLKEATGNLGNSIKDRLSNKALLGYDITFRTLINSVKALLTSEQFQNEIDLAEHVLATTVVTSKYAVRNLQLKGHTDADYTDDVKDFREVYRKCKKNLVSLEVSADDCCRITVTSSLSDLQDEDFTQLLDLNKYEFLKSFTMSGIPVYAPTRDSAQINPWTYSIRKILTSPYTILSQVAMEGMAESNPGSVGDKHKEMKIQQDSEDTKFNAIIPVFPPNFAKHLQLIMRTRLYAMCCTFAILKTPHIVDFNAHMAGLGVTWVRILFENPEQPRPEYVRYRIECIEATAFNYSDRPSFATYRDTLKSNPVQAIMTESSIEVDGKTLKCESLIKPMFILHLAKTAGKIDEINDIKRIVELLLIEYIGRCLSNYDKREMDPPAPHTPYCDFFAETIADEEQKKIFVKQNVELSQRKIVNKKENLLQEFYYIEQCEKAAKIAAKEETKHLASQLVSNIPIKVSMNKVNKLRNIASCGDVSWRTLRTFAKEVGLADDDIQNLFNDQNVFRYVAHALKYRNSRERLETTLSDYISYEKEVTQKVQSEAAKYVSRALFESLVNEMLTAWNNAYEEVHKEIVEPMTKSQIIKESMLRGINVNEENFDNVYKRFRSNVGLLGNACQCKKCPWYLKPNRSYNQHSFAERQTEKFFPHALHIATQKYRDSSVDEITKIVLSGECTKATKDGKRKQNLENEDNKKSLKYDISGLKDKYIQLA